VNTEREEFGMNVELIPDEPSDADPGSAGPAGPDLPESANAKARPQAVAASRLRRPWPDPSAEPTQPREIIARLKNVEALLISSLAAGVWGNRIPPAYLQTACPPLAERIRKEAQLIDESLGIHGLATTYRDLVDQLSHDFKQLRQVMGCDGPGAPGPLAAWDAIKARAEAAEAALAEARAKLRRLGVPQE